MTNYGKRLQAILKGSERKKLFPQEIIFLVMGGVVS